MRLRLGGAEIDPEFCVALRLNIVGNVLSVDAYNNFQITCTCLRGINAKVDWFLYHATGEVSDQHFCSVVGFDHKWRALHMKIGDLDFHLVVSNLNRMIIDAIVTFTDKMNATRNNLSGW